MMCNGERWCVFWLYVYVYVYGKVWWKYGMDNII